MKLLFLIIGLILIILNFKMIKPKKNKKIEFLEVIENKEKNLDETTLEIGKIRRNMGESLTELQLEIKELKTEIAYLKIKINYLEKNNRKNIDEKPYIGYNKSGLERKESINKENISKKEWIKKYIESGLTDEEICKKVEVNKGEVLLIRGLLK